VTGIKHWLYLCEVYLLLSNNGGSFIIWDMFIFLKGGLPGIQTRWNMEKNASQVFFEEKPFSRFYIFIYKEASFPEYSPLHLIRPDLSFYLI
jgi:hypothetical protein